MPFCSPLCLFARHRILRGVVAGALLFAFTAAGLRADEASRRTADGPAAQALLEAVRGGEPALVTSALAQGADPNGKAADAATPLLELLRRATTPLTKPQRDCLALLLEHGADPNAQDSDRRHALIFAARLGDLASVRLLVESEADVRSRDRFHRTALMYAVEAGRRDIVDYLARNGDLQSLPYREQKKLKQGKS